MNLNEVYYGNAEGEGKKVLPYAIRFKSPDELGKFGDFLAKEGFSSVAQVMTQSVMLVNMAFKKWTTPQAPCKHGHVNDRFYSEGEFMKEVFLHWKAENKDNN